VPKVTPTFKELAAACTGFLAGDGRRTTSTLLSQISEGVEMDAYGDGGVVTELEEFVATLLGKEKALFMPTGIMTQQATLRVLCDRAQNPRVAFHQMTHLRTHEENAFARLHGLQEVIANPGWPQEPITLKSLKAIKEPVGALLLELPQRDMGGYLPTWSELVTQTKWARKKGIALHLDGARLWEAAPYYAATAKKSMKDICALFDTVYVSFYKGLGGISGSCVAGKADIIDEVSLWRTRHGGRAYMLWPYAASALQVVKTRPKDMGAYYRRAVALSKKLRSIEGIEVLPDEVRSPMMHLRFSATKEEMEARVRRIAAEQKIMTLPGIFLSESSHLQRYEYQVGRASMELSLDEMVDLFKQLAGH